MRPFEPLGRSAPLAWSIAPNMCQDDPETGGNCSVFHGTWQYLRLLKIIHSISSDRDFLLEAFANLARQGSGYQRILIAGAADYAMLSYLAAAFRNEAAIPKITVLDICPTPLFLNRWYAREISLPIRVCHANIFDFEARRPFDLLCTHSFMWHVAPHRRTDLIAKWRHLVRPGGKLITSQRVLSGSANQGASWSSGEAAKIRDHVLEAVSRHSHLSAGLPAGLVKAVVALKAHAKRRQHPIDAKKMIDLLRSCGFSIETLEITSPEGIPRDLDAPPHESEAERLRVIAVRD